MEHFESLCSNLLVDSMTVLNTATVDACLVVLFWLHGLREPLLLRPFLRVNPFLCTRLIQLVYNEFVVCRYFDTVLAA